jgi:hypothetical protein
MPVFEGMGRNTQGGTGIPWFDKLPSTRFAAQAPNRAAMTILNEDMPGKSLGNLRSSFGHTLFLCVQSPKNEQEKTFTVQPDIGPGQTMAIETQCIWIGFYTSGRSSHR